MKYIKEIISTLMFLIALLILIPLMGILMMYSSDADVPAAFTYSEMDDGINWAEYLDKIDFENMTDIEIGEKEVNLFLNTYVEMGMAQSDDLLVNYAYLDFRNEQIEAVSHVDLLRLMEFPVKIRIIMNNHYEEGILSLTLDRIYLGKLRVPNFVTRYVLEMSEIRSLYLDHRNLSFTIDIGENNPYSEIVELKNLWIDEEAIHLEIGLSEFISEEVVKPSVKIVGESIEELYGHLDQEEQAAADVILEFVEENPDIDPAEIGLKEAEELLEAYNALSPEVQDKLVENIELHLDEETLEQLKLYMSEMMRELNE